MRAAVLLSLLASAAAVRVHGRAVPRRAALASPALLWPAPARPPRTTASRRSPTACSRSRSRRAGRARCRSPRRSRRRARSARGSRRSTPRRRAHHRRRRARDVRRRARATCGRRAAGRAQAVRGRRAGADAGEEVAAAGGWERLGGAERAGRALLARRRVPRRHAPLAGPTTFRGARARARATGGRARRDVDVRDAARRLGARQLRDDVLVRRGAARGARGGARARRRACCSRRGRERGRGRRSRRDDGTEAGAVGRDITAALGSFELVRQ